VRVPKNFINPGRFYGMSKDIKESIPDGERIEMNENELRDLMQKLDGTGEELPRIPKYYFRRNPTITQCKT